LGVVNSRGDNASCVVLTFVLRLLAVNLSIRSGGRFVALVCGLSMATALAPVAPAALAKPAAQLSYANAPWYGCSKAGKSLEWYNPGVPYPCAGTIDPKTVANRELYYDFMHRAWVNGDLSVLDRYVDPNTYDYSPLHPPEKGTKGFAGIIKTFRGALSDIRLDFSDMAEGNLVTHFWKLSGVHNKAPLFGAPASGRRVSLNGISTVEIKGNKVVGRWSQLDIQSLMIQLGLMKPPGGKG
jgi:predicted ester cyclase